MAVRLALCLAVWTVFAFALSRLSKRQDEAPVAGPRAPDAARRGARASRSTASSSRSRRSTSSCRLDPHWYSAIYGIYVVGGQAISGMAFTLLAALFLARNGALPGRRPAAPRPRLGQAPPRVHDALGVLLRSPSSSSSGRATSRRRSRFYKAARDGRLDGRLARARALPLRRAVRLPALARTSRSKLGRLSVIAALLLFMRAVDLFWLVAPAFHPEGLALHWLDARASRSPSSASGSPRSRASSASVRSSPSTTRTSPVAMEVHAHG